MSTWIDFKELRAKLTFEQLLRHYGVEPKVAQYPFCDTVLQEHYFPAFPGI